MISYNGSIFVKQAPPKKDCNFDTKLQSFLTKSAYVGINPLTWMKSLCDEILLRKVILGGFDFISGDTPKISSEFTLQRAKIAL